LALRFPAAALLLEFFSKGSGVLVDNDTTHRGIAYSIRRLSEQRWKWKIEPPNCIRGLSSKDGEVDGARTDAIAAACNAIELQTRQFTQ